MNPLAYFEEIGAWPRAGGALRGYVLGFLWSLLLTLLAYDLALGHMLARPAALAAIVLLAGVQFLLQLVYFLHLSIKKEAAARERLIILACTLLIVAILVSGSLWIMLDLNQRMMPDTAQMNQYMDSQSGL